MLTIKLRLLNCRSPKWFGVRAIVVTHGFSIHSDAGNLRHRTPMHTDERGSKVNVTIFGIRSVCTLLTSAFSRSSLFGFDPLEISQGSMERI